MNGNIQTIALWLFSMGLAFFIGSQSSKTVTGGNIAPSSQGESSKNAPKTLQAGKAKAHVGNMATITGEGEPRFVSYLQDPMTSSDFGISLLASMKAGDPILRIRAFTDALQDLDGSTLPGILEAFDILPRGSQRFTELRMLMHAWADKDPEAALEYASKMSRQERQFAISEALASWAKNFPEAALDWAEMEAGGRDNNPYMPAIISGTAETDMQKATSLLFEMSYGYMRGSALRNLIGKNIQEGGIRQLEGWANSLPLELDPKLMEGISSMVASQLADYDLEAAGNWVKKLPEGDGRQKAMSTIIRELANDSTESAKEWLLSLPEKDRYAGMPELIRKWANEDPGSAGEWLNQFPPSEQMDKAVSTYVRAIRRGDPAAAKEWASSIVNEDTRKKVVESIDRPPNSFRFDGGEVKVEGDVGIDVKGATIRVTTE